MALRDTFDELIKEHTRLTDELADPDAYKRSDYSQISKKHAKLSEVVALIEELNSVQNEIKETKDLLQEDGEMAELAETELSKLENRETEITETLEEKLTPKDPDDEKNAVIEIRAGAGGDESSLFAGELYRMYNKYAERNGWKIEIESESPSDVGGFKEIIFTISGDDVYGEMKFEAGVHRVQRVPETESSGRIHTSTVTVAVLPEAEEAEVSIDPSDLRIDTYRASGHGGQSVNTTDSAIRITHEPTGIVVTCQDEKSQHKNKEKAMRVLRTRLLAEQRRKEQERLSEKRKSLIGSGDRSEKVRTYNFPQDRITDHRINMSKHGIDQFLDGDIQEMLDALKKRELELLRNED